MKKLLVIALLLFFANNQFAQRIKDITYFRGLNSEQLIGYGLVVGLAGTGDSYRSSFTVQSVTSMLKRFGITVPDDVNLRTKNIAAVMVTARVNNLQKLGSEFDVVVSSLGDATSLMGGTLLLTPLSVKDGSIAALAQGPISIGGFDINTGSGGRVAKNHALSGRIPNGGIMQAEFDGSNPSGELVTVLLKSPDFTTANNISNVVNQKFGENTSLAMDASEIRVNVPAEYQNRLTAFLAELEALEVQTDVAARVVLNERTGTVVAGSSVKILPATISHGNLSIEIRSYPVISQPGAFSQGTTALFNNQVPYVNQDQNNVVSIQGANNVQEVAAALNSLKVSPRDIIAIFQALKEAGALQAELIIM